MGDTQAVGPRVPPSPWYGVGLGVAGGPPYPDIIVVLQAILHVVQELADVQLAQAALKQRVHALKGRLPHVQPVVHCVLKGPHFHLQEGRVTRVMGWDSRG